jgi:hypothetical protein
MLLGLCWDAWSAIGVWATVAVAAVAFVVALFAWKEQRRSFKREMVSDLYSEYATQQMGEAVALIHKEFRKSTRLVDYAKHDETRHKLKWVNHYVREYKRGRRDLHWARRLVSAFFQRIVYSAHDDAYAKRIAMTMWGATENFMVLHILEPIETIGMAKVLGVKPPKDEKEDNPAVRLMREFWSTSKRATGKSL